MNTATIGSTLELRDELETDDFALDDALLEGVNAAAGFPCCSIACSQDPDKR